MYFCFGGFSLPVGVGMSLPLSLLACWCVDEEGKPHRGGMVEVGHAIRNLEGLGW